MDELLRMEHVSKRFGDFYANRDINLSVRKGEVHTLLGENGAGKSTLMNVLIGLYQPTEGKIFLNGKEVRIDSPAQAVKLGIGMVHQHFMLVEAMTVFENIILGDRNTKGIFIDKEARKKEILDLAERYGLDVELDRPITEIAVGAQQRVEILKTLYRGAELLILDEPTAALTDIEVEGLFQIIHKLTEEGKSVIFISHKMREVLQISDRITILRTGEVITTLARSTPLIFTSLCACFAYRCGVFNLGGEGQFLMGSIVCCYIATQSGIEGLPATLLCLVGGAVAGGLWSLISGLLKVYRGQNEMIITIMLNYVATLFMGVVYTDWLRDGSVPQTQAVPEATQLSRLFGLRVTSAFVIALAVGLLVYYFLFYTSKGFQLRAVGLNMTAAEFNGFAVKKYILMSFIVSGAIAGLGGSAELLGTQFRLINGFGNGYGFDGVAMALIGQLHPLATIVVAIFFAALRVGSTTMQAATGVPTSVSDIIQALVIVFTVAGLAMVKLPGFKAFLGRLTERRKEAA